MVVHSDRLEPHSMNLAMSADARLLAADGHRPAATRTRAGLGLLLALAWLTSSGCSSAAPTGPDDGSSGDLSRADGGSVAAGDAGDSDAGPPPAARGQVVLDACLGLTGVAERCTLVTNASACTTTRCSKLVVVFSGGEMGCVTGAGYRKVLDGYAARGYAAVCINYFDTAMGSAQAPYVDEAARLDVALREATTGNWARAYWTGEDLLLEGISHGATAPVILMARTTLDDQPHWHGSRFTGGCFFDGSYDQAATASLLATGAVGGNACTVPVSHTRWLERYCGPGATAATCNLSTQPKAQEDTVTSVLPATFAIRDLKLFECGSALAACTGDIVAGPPIEALCQRLDASPTHTCSFVSLPTDGHLTCHANQYDACRTWFEGLLPR
jgi:hypothetical protein